MKNLIYAVLCLVILVSHNINAQIKPKGNKMADKKVLIAYYSKSGNTEQIAKYIQEATGGDMFAIEPVKPYPEEYRATTEQAKKEINEGYLPPIKSKVGNIADYNVIFIGSPCWWATIAPPVSTFLKEHDLSKKIVIPFSTHAGSGLANNARDTAKLAPNSVVLDGKAFRGGSVSSAKEETRNWIDSLKF